MPAPLGNARRLGRDRGLLWVGPVKTLAPAVLEAGLRRVRVLEVGRVDVARQVSTPTLVAGAQEGKPDVVQTPRLFRQGHTLRPLRPTTIFVD